MGQQASTNGVDVATPSDSPALVEKPAATEQPSEAAEAVASDASAVALVSASGSHAAAAGVEAGTATTPAEGDGATSTPPPSSTISPSRISALRPKALDDPDDGAADESDGGPAVVPTGHAAEDTRAANSSPTVVLLDEVCASPSPGHGPSPPLWPYTPQSPHPRIMSWQAEAEIHRATASNNAGVPWAATPMHSWPATPAPQTPVAMVNPAVDVQHAMWPQQHPLLGSALPPSWAAQSLEVPFNQAASGYPFNHQALLDQHHQALLLQQAQATAAAAVDQRKVQAQQALARQHAWAEKLRQQALQAPSASSSPQSWPTAHELLQASKATSQVLSPAAKQKSMQSPMTPQRAAEGRGGRSPLSTPAGGRKKSPAGAVKLRVGKHGSWANQQDEMEEQQRKADAEVDDEDNEEDPAQPGTRSKRHRGGRKRRGRKEGNMAGEDPKVETSAPSASPQENNGADAPTKPLRSRGKFLSYAEAEAKGGARGLPSEAGVRGNQAVAAAAEESNWEGASRRSRRRGARRG